MTHTHKEKKKECCQQCTFYHRVFILHAGYCCCGTLTLEHTKAHIQAQDSHIPATVSLKHKQKRVHTHTHTLQHIPRGALQRCSHVAMAPVSLGQRAVVSDHLFSSPPCLFSKDSVINSLTRD